MKLWSGFKPRVPEIQGRKNQDFYSVQVFKPGTSFETFNEETEFENWAAVEVNDSESAVPDGLEVLHIPSGKYAVFIHQGLPQDFHKTSQYIYTEWLPNSKFEMRESPHFEVMQPDYSPTDPNAMEEVWVPIQYKK